MTTKDDILRDALMGNKEREIESRLSVEKLLDKYQASSKKYSVVIKRITLAQEQKELVNDYKKVRYGLLALEQIKQVISQGQSTKVGAPDGTDAGKQLSILEKLAANIMGWLGLSSTGMAQESETVLSTEQRYEHLIQSLSFNISKISNALESVQGHIDPEILSAIKAGEAEPNMFENADASKTL